MNTNLDLSAYISSPQRLYYDTTISLVFYHKDIFCVGDQSNFLIITLVNNIFTVHSSYFSYYLLLNYDTFHKHEVRPQDPFIQF